jgi:hypothetical protein
VTPSLRQRAGAQARGVVEEERALLQERAWGFGGCDPAEFGRDMSLEQGRGVGIFADAEAQPVRGAGQPCGVPAMELCA